MWGQACDGDPSCCSSLLVFHPQAQKDGHMGFGREASVWVTGERAAISTSRMKAPASSRHRQNSVREFTQPTGHAHCPCPGLCTKSRNKETHSSIEIQVIDIKAFRMKGGNLRREV